MHPRFHFYHPCLEPCGLKARPAEEYDWTIPYSLQGKQLQCIGLQVVPAHWKSCCHRYASAAADGFDLAAMLESVASEWALCKPTAPKTGKFHMFENMALIPIGGFNPQLVQALPDITLLTRLELATRDPCWFDHDDHPQVITLKPQQVKAKLTDAFHALPRGDDDVKHHLHVTVVVIQESVPLKKALVAAAMPFGGIMRPDIGLTPTFYFTPDLAKMVVIDLKRLQLVHADDMFDL